VNSIDWAVELKFQLAHQQHSRRMLALSPNTAFSGVTIYVQGRFGIQCGQPAENAGGVNGAGGQSRTGYAGLFRAALYR
jgi:hypothetical protein